MFRKNPGVSNPGSVFKTDIKAAGGKFKLAENTKNYVKNEKRRK